MLPQLGAVAKEKAKANAAIEATAEAAVPARCGGGRMRPGAGAART